jgi:hypothetical protein
MSINDFIKALREEFGQGIAYRVKAKDGRVFESNNWKQVTERLNEERLLSKIN